MNLTCFLREQILRGDVGFEHGDHGHFVVQGADSQKKYGELHFEYPGRIVTLTTDIANKEQYPESMSVPAAVYGHIFNPDNNLGINNVEDTIYYGGPSFDLNKKEITTLIDQLHQDKP